MKSITGKCHRYHQQELPLAGRRHEHGPADGQVGALPQAPRHRCQQHHRRVDPPYPQRGERQLPIHARTGLAREVDIGGFSVEGHYLKHVHGIYLSLAQGQNENDLVTRHHWDSNSSVPLETYRSARAAVRPVGQLQIIIRTGVDAP